MPNSIFFPRRGGDSNLNVSQTQGRRRTKMTHFLNMGFKHGKKWVDKNGAKCNMGFGRITKNTPCWCLLVPVGVVCVVPVGACWCLLVLCVLCVLCVCGVCVQDFWASPPDPPSAGPPFPWTAQNFALFFLSPSPKISFFLLSLGGLLVEFWWCLKRRGAPMCTFGLSGCGVKPPAAAPTNRGANQQGHQPTGAPTNRGTNQQGHQPTGAPTNRGTNRHQQGHQQAPTGAPTGTNTRKFGKTLLHYFWPTGAPTSTKRHQQAPTGTNRHQHQKIWQNTKTLKLAKVGLAKVGQHSKILKLAKVGLAKVGHDPSAPTLRAPTFSGGPHFFWVRAPLPSAKLTVGFFCLFSCPSCLNSCPSCLFFVPFLPFFRALRLCLLCKRQQVAIFLGFSQEPVWTKFTETFFSERSARVHEKKKPKSQKTKEKRHAFGMVFLFFFDVQKKATTTKQTADAFGTAFCVVCG